MAEKLWTPLGSQEDALHNDKMTAAYWSWAYDSRYVCNQRLKASSCL